MAFHASRIAAAIGAAFLLTSVVSAPAQAMLAPFDPAPDSAIGLDSTTPHCFMGHESWPAAVQPQEACTS